MSKEKPTIESSTSCAIVGGSRGIGLATATKLTRDGVRTLITSSKPETGSRASQSIQDASGRNVPYLSADLASIRSVDSLAEAIIDSCPRLNRLILCAGVACPSYCESVDGIEQTFAVNHLAGFHLANRLTPLLEANAPSRIVVVASQIHAGNFKGDFETKEPDYNGYTVYEESKLANVLFTYELARKLEGKQVTVNCLHPGVIQTKLLENLSKSKSSSGNGSRGGLSMKKIARALKWRTKKILGIKSGDTVESAAALIGQLVKILILRAYPVNTSIQEKRRNRKWPPTASLWQRNSGTSPRR